MTKLTLIFLLMSNISFASDKSINEEKVLTHLHYLYKKIKIKGDTVHVRGPMLSKRIKPGDKKAEKFSLRKRKFTITLDDFNFEKSLAQNTFTAISNDGTGRGTSFYVGGAFVLTNYHVYNREYKMTKCHLFKIKLNPDLGGSSFKCKKVHHCSKELDYCLVEMKDNGKRTLESFTHHPRLKLEIEQNQIVRLIGNVKASGLQASRATGLRLREKTYLHNAPLFKGASGGPLFNDSGEVIGINYAETQILKGPKAYNFATPLKFIKEDLQNNILTEILEQTAL